MFLGCLQAILSFAAQMPLLECFVSKTSVERTTTKLSQLLHSKESLALKGLIVSAFSVTV